ncbi:MAG: zinc metallopeptidase [Bacteroidetes bacterium]|nr:zinc metallopeptidase [Bacteroidota bacterium]
MEFIILGIGAFVLSLLVSWRFKSKITKYSLIPLRNGMSGKDIAEKMLKDHNIYDVRVISVEGQLTDHYNPLDKTVNLSADVYAGRSITSAAVAAHECGHAVQHASAYSWLTMRSKLVPIVSMSSQYVQWILLAGIFLINRFPNLLLIGIALFALTTLFSFITLPVEFNASRRALAWLDNTHMLETTEHANAQDALKWAAMTYVVAAVASLATLLYYIMIYMNKGRD